MSYRGVVNNLRGGGLSVLASNHIAVTATMTSATWNTAAKHETFTVTGLCRLRMWIECTDTLVDAADGASIQFGHESATNAFIASTGAAGAGAVTISTGELWYDATPTTALDTTALTVLDYVVNGLDVGYEITGAALTGGALVFHCVWEPLNDSGNVVAGTGAAL